MTYDHWKTTDTGDETLGSTHAYRQNDPDGDTFGAMLSEPEVGPVDWDAVFEASKPSFRKGDTVYNPYVAKYALVLDVRPNDQILVAYEDAPDNRYLVRSWLLQSVEEAA